MSAHTERLRVLQVHDRYAPGWGGEDTVVHLEHRMLVERGHAVEQFQASHALLKSAPVLRQMLAVPGFLWSRRSYRALGRRIAEFQPDVIHVHNTFPQLSPSVFWAAHRAHVPVVQTLHNFRHVCANSLLLRDGSHCQECVGQSPWPALRYRCFAGSLARTAAVVAVNTLHSKIGTYRRRVDAYIILNEFNREIFRLGDFPDNRLYTKANFVPLYILSGEPRKRNAVFVGTISQSKGVPLLLEAWTMAALPKCKLLLVGDGPERASLQMRYANLPDVQWCGRLDRADVLKLVAASRLLVFPSLAYENSPMAVLEALSVATPVVAADHPSLQAMISHGREGLLFRAGSIDSLAAALQAGLHCSEETWSAWSSAARQTHAERYSETVNYQRLISIYEAAIEGRASRAAVTA